MKMIMMAVMILGLVPHGLRPLKQEAKALCPVAASSAFNNTWRAPRPGGRLHRGTDVYAVRGAPLVAPESGIVRLGQNRLGGIVLWIEGTDSGNRYYMAHLESWASELVTSGQWVKVGWVVGYVGNSGNAKHTPPHVHIEVRVGGRNVNPYPWLNESCRNPNIPAPTFAPEQNVS